MTSSVARNGGALVVRSGSFTAYVAAPDLADADVELERLAGRLEEVMALACPQFAGEFEAFTAHHLRLTAAYWRALRFCHTSRHVDPRRREALWRCAYARRARVTTHVTGARSRLSVVQIAA